MYPSEDLQIEFFFFPQYYQNAEKEMNLEIEN